MSVQNQGFTIRASASRLDKGLLAIPQKFKALFPAEQERIWVAFDDEKQTRQLTFHPYDSRTKEIRIFGLRNWFKARGVRPGDTISITLEQAEPSHYRIALDRYLQEREETQARRQLERAQTEEEAEQQFQRLSRLSKCRARQVAEQELLRISHESRRKPRPTILPAAAERYEGVPAGIRVLLSKLHDGKCQLCTFTFKKRNGEPFFEIHHVNPKVGHHPTNLLVVCPNCHARLEHATVTDLRWTGEWLVSVTINGTQQSIRQPLAHDMSKKVLFVTMIVAAVQAARMLLFRRSLPF